MDKKRRNGNQPKQHLDSDSQFVIQSFSQFIFEQLQQSFS